MIFLAIPTWIVVFSSSSPFSSSFLAEPASLSSSRWHVADTADVLACGAYLAGVATCFVLSTAFHTLMAHSERVYLAGMKLDVQGVLALMWGATAPLLRFLFPGASSRGRDLDQSLDTWCTARHDGHGDDERLRLAYGVVVALLAAACSAATFLPCLSGPRLGPWRAALFGSFAVCSFALPIAHAVVRVGWDEVCARVALRWVGFTAVLNGIGVVVYALKVSLLPCVSGLYTRTSADECGLFVEYSFLRGGSRDGSTSSARAISSCTFSWSLRLSRMPVLLYWRLTIVTRRMPFVDRG